MEVILPAAAAAAIIAAVIMVPLAPATGPSLTTVPGSGTIIFCSAFVGHSLVEIPESRSSDEPSPSSQEGDADRSPTGSCLMFCRANSAVAASLSPRCDLWRSFTGRLLACSWISRSHRSGSSSPQDALPALAVEERGGLAPLTLAADPLSYGDGARRLRFSTFAVSVSAAFGDSSPAVRGGEA
uniref:Putative secreted protein n=1 Tax=Anopheles darlingi TaxID=43151 RepID=A0A2M4D5M1_ANODA